LSYLEPPPHSAPVIVMKDTGGLVSEYQARTEMYRITNREVRLHECRSACTLALSLPNVCVYPGSLLKFHLAYNELTRQSDYGVSQQLFQSYPPAVQERLGGLTRQYKVLSGSELIKLGIRDCSEPRAPEPKIILVKVTPQPVQTVSGGSLDLGLRTMWRKVVTGILGGAMMPIDKPGARSLTRPGPSAPAFPQVKPAYVPPLPLPVEQPWPPEPPARPSDFMAPPPAQEPQPAPVKQEEDAIVAGTYPDSPQPIAPPRTTPLPPPRQVDQGLFATQATLESKLTHSPRVKLMSGANTILPARFTAYVKISMR